MRLTRVFSLAAALLACGCAGNLIAVPVPYRSSDWVTLPTEPADAPALKVDDYVQITHKKNGKQYRFTVVRLTDDGFIGVQDDKKTYEVLYKDLSTLEVERAEWHSLPVPVACCL